MLGSPQKKPRLYGVTAFNSHAKNGMEAGKMWKRKGGEEEEKTKDFLMNVCDVVYTTRITEREKYRARHRGS